MKPNNIILPNDLGRQFSLHAEEYEQKAVEVLSLPMYNDMTAAEQRQVIDAVNEFKETGQ